MGKLEKDAAREFSKLSKKEQQRINKLKRIPVPRPAQLHDKRMFPGKRSGTKAERNNKRTAGR